MITTAMTMATAAIAAAALVGCSATGETAGPASAKPSDTTPTTTVATRPAETTSSSAPDLGSFRDPDCPLSVDVGALVGAPVTRSSTGGGHGSSDGVSYSYEGCRYRLTTGDGWVRVVRITAESNGSGSAFSQLDREAMTDAAANGSEQVPPSRFATSYEGVTIGEITAYDTGDELTVDDSDRPLRITTDGLDLEPAAAAELRIAVAELVLHGS